MVHKPSRNSFLAPGIPRLSRSQVITKKGLFKRTPKAAAKPEVTATTKSVQLKDGKERVIPVTKASRYYAAEDVAVPKKHHKRAGVAKLRASITPGTVLILLAGAHRGKRVVFLKQLASGLLLVTGPYKVNGVPLRRVNQAYVIATSTKLKISAVDEKFNDDYFKKEKKTSKRPATEEEFFAEAEKKGAYPESKAADQKAVDAQIVAAIKKVQHLGPYLGSTFSLRKGEAVHALKF